MDDLDIPVTFGEWLKSRRKAFDLTQEELARRSGCSVFALRKIESGERRPSKQLASLLAKSLEIQPDDQQIFIRVARGELNLERLCSSSFTFKNAVSPEIKPISPHLPLPNTPLIGRDAELAALERLFTDPQCRLLTLVGMGGIGKTRLAIEFASRQLLMFPGGVFFVSLASLSSADLVIPAIANGFGFAFSGPTNPKDQLMNYLATRTNQEFLLVLDNLEHLLPPYQEEGENSEIIGLVKEILQRLPKAKFLATSRERLNLHGEWIFELHGLPVPPQDFSSSLEDYGAVGLFVHNARQVKSDFEIQKDEEPALIRICCLLDGVPLAIELAAAWVRLLACEEIAHEIESSLDFLTTTMRDVPERHRSMRATIDHSWKFLSDEECRVLQRLSVFHGGFSRHAAEQVAGASLPLLASLHAKSLVHRADNGRYDLHEVIRQYALIYFDLDQQNIEIHDRHSEYYLNLLRDREKALKSGAQQKAIRELMDEIDNLRAAWGWAVKRKQFTLLGASVRSLGWMFEVAGLLREGIDTLEQLVQALKKDPRIDQWGRPLGLALAQQGLLYFRKGELVHACDLYVESIDILRPVRDQALLADALVLLGVLTHINGDYEKSKALLREGLACAQVNNDQWFMAYAIYNLGYVDSLMGNYQNGYEQMMKGLETWRTLGDPHSIALGLNYLVSTLIKLGRYEEAKTLMYESIGLCEKTRNRWGMGTAYRFLGLAALEEGMVEEAQTYFRKSLEIFGKYIEGWDIARTLTFLGDALFIGGNLKESKKHYLDALSLAIEANSFPLALDAIVGLARIHRCYGDTVLAFALARHVYNHTAATQATREIARQLIVDLEKQLGDDRIRAIGERTVDQSLETIVETCLGQRQPRQID